MNIKEIMNVSFIKDKIYPTNEKIQRLCKLYSSSNWYYKHSCNYEKDGKLIIPIASKLNDNKKKIILELVLDNNDKKAYLRQKNCSKKELAQINNQTINPNDYNLVEMAVEIINSNYSEMMNLMVSTVAINRFNL